MRVVTIARKPFSGSVAQNALEWGTGGINVDGCRIGPGTYVPGGGNQKANHGGKFGGGADYKGIRPVVLPHMNGRWPANLILVHKPSCEQTGTTTSKGYTINRFTDGAKPFGDGAGHPYESERQPDEKIAVWKCDPDCGVHELNDQSGYLKTGKVASHSDRGIWNSGADVDYVDSEIGGGASRFFMQVRSGNGQQELLDYLGTMIRPPEFYEPVVITEQDLSNVDWSQYEDKSVHGLITVGDVSEWTRDIDRVLKPGAHILLIAPEEQPTNHTSACNIEDFGYEIRDSILLIDKPGGFHYVSKASSAERNDGVKERTLETVEELAFIPLGTDPRELHGIIPGKLLRRLAKGHGVSVEDLEPDMLERLAVREIRSVRNVRNHHPTVKSRKMFEALLEDVPKDFLVLDPFIGSGSTALACLNTGHSLVGIDREHEYLDIAYQRVRYWDRNENAWVGAEIESDVEPTDEEDEIDFLGLSGQ